ncbi:hypothetical protein DFJ77DRAFT_448200 [Powellomyces hirtus]|nr:hypothetical protein DFJ77DRAFT_448200 [Powellomyces hirtus]
MVNAQCSIRLDRAVTLGPAPHDVSFIASNPSALSLVLSDRFDAFLDPPPVLVSGTVRLENVQAGVTSIDITLLGMEKEAHPANPFVEKYLVKETVELWKGDGRLPDGSHEFPFSIPLPSDVPPTLKVQYGEVFYRLTVALHRKFLPQLTFHQQVDVRRCYPSRAMSRSQSRSKSPASRKAMSPQPRSPILGPRSIRSNSTDSRRSGSADPLSPTLAPPVMLERTKETFSGPTGEQEFTYTVSLTRPILRDDVETKIDLHLENNKEKVGSVRTVECTLVETRSFRSDLISFHAAMPTYKPATEECVLTKPPVKYKLSQHQIMQQRHTLPFSLLVSEAAPDVATPTLAICHVVRIVIEYEPGGNAESAAQDDEQDRGRSLWRDVTTPKGSVKKHKKHLVVEVPAYIADAVDAEEEVEDEEDVDNAAETQSKAAALGTAIPTLCRRQSDPRDVNRPSSASTLFLDRECNQEPDDLEFDMFITPATPASLILAQHATSSNPFLSAAAAGSETLLHSNTPLRRRDPSPIPLQRSLTDVCAGAATAAASPPPAYMLHCGSGSARPTASRGNSVESLIGLQRRTHLEESAANKRNSSIL